MNVRWFTTIAIFLLLALAIHSASALPRQEYGEVSDSRTWLRFSRTLALSDPDSSRLNDEIKRIASGSHKAVPIVLRGAPSRSFLDFLYRGGAHGSLLTQDVDDDGASDLVWKDLRRANNIIVWLGGGGIQFQRLTNCEDSRAFTLGDTSVGAPADLNEEPAVNFETYRPLDHTILSKCIDRAATQLPSEVFDRIVISPPRLDQPADRGPPRRLY